MKGLTLIAVLFLSACTVDNYEVKNAEMVCENNGGWRSLTLGPFPYARCNDGVVLDKKDLKRKREDLK